MNGSKKTGSGQQINGGVKQNRGYGMVDLKCSKCSKEATFDSPALLCDEHWAEWWAVEDNTEPQRAETIQKRSSARYQKEISKEKAMPASREEIVELLKKLYETLERREKDYMNVMGTAQDAETKVSFTARASEVGIFKDDLDMLFERIL